MFRRTFVKLAAAALIHPALNWTGVSSRRGFDEIADSDEGLTVEKLLQARETLLEDSSFGVSSAFLVVYGKNIAEVARRHLPGVRVIQSERCHEGRDKAGDLARAGELKGGGFRFEP